MTSPEPRQLAIALGVAIGVGLVGWLIPTDQTHFTLASLLALSAFFGSLILSLFSTTKKVQIAGRPLQQAVGQSPESPALESADSRITLFVGNLSFKANTEQLRDLFGAYGTVHSARIMSDRMTRRPRGFGFVEMDVLGGKKAIAQLDGNPFMGRALRVNEGLERKRFGLGDEGNADADQFSVSSH
ncbi:MAG: hypothetical protein HQL49_00960 [Gammaproteobacteria bacterium]|nr:hypothetical protein [Gammaproteobacteria bacterium]